MDFISLTSKLWENNEITPSSEKNTEENSNLILELVI